MRSTDHMDWKVVACASFEVDEEVTFSLLGTLTQRSSAVQASVSALASFHGER